MRAGAVTLKEYEMRWRADARLAKTSLDFLLDAGRVRLKDGCLRNRRAEESYQSAVSRLAHSRHAAQTRWRNDRKKGKGA